MTDPAAVPPPSPGTPSGSTVRRWTFWAAFVLAVGAAAVLARRASLDERAQQVASDEVAERIEAEIDRGLADAADAAHSAHEALVASHGDAPPHRIADGPPAPRTIAGPAGPPATGSARELTHSATIAPGGKLRFEVDSGDVQVVRALGAEAKVTATVVGAGSDRWRLEQVATSSELVHLRLTSGDDDDSERGTLSLLGGALRLARGHRSADVSVRIELPAGVATDVETGAGDVVARDVASHLGVSTGAGDVHATGVEGRLHVETGAGDVEVRDARAAVEIESGAGDVDVDGPSSSVEIETGAGDVAVRGAHERVELSSGAGSIELGLTGIGEHVEVTTGMGSIELHVASGGFRLEAESGLGSVEVTRGGRTEHSSSMGSRVERTFDGGGPLVELESGAGSIAVVIGATVE